MQLPWSAELKPRSVVLFLILLSVRDMYENLLNALCIYFIYSIKETAWAVSKRTSKTCPFVELCRMR